MRATIVGLILLLTIAAQAAEFDLVINNGRVLDPETSLDAIRDIGIRSGQIIRISETPLRGERTIDASGLIVTPGFIDLHAHGQDERSNQFQVADGVTTALELEQGVLPVGPWLESRRGRSPIHYGAASGHLAARINLVTGLEVGNPVYLSTSDRSAAQGDDYANAVLSAEALKELIESVEAGIRDGGLGIGSGITYMPGATHEEIFSLFKLAASVLFGKFVEL